MGCIKLIAYYTIELYVRQRSLNKMVQCGQSPSLLKKEKKNSSCGNQVRFFTVIKRSTLLIRNPPFLKCFQSSS